MNHVLVECAQGCGAMAQVRTGLLGRMDLLRKGWDDQSSEGCAWDCPKCCEATEGQREPSLPPLSRRRRYLTGAN